MDKEQVLAILIGQDYYTQEDLRYNSKHGFMFSKEQMAEFLEIKETLLDEGNDIFFKLPLVTFNSPYCFFTDGLYLNKGMHTYVTTVLEDYEQHDKSLIERNIDDILMSRVFSEIEGTLNIENVPTTHKRIRDIFNKSPLTDKNDIIIKNMINAMLFIIDHKPAFDKNNLYHLYGLLSDGCLDSSDRLLSGKCYRHEQVFIGGFEGAPVDRIDEMMDSLFEFVNNADKNDIKYQWLLPHICHYYILYVHPYFDYNGRTARMVSFWLSYIFDFPTPPHFISEAITAYKSEYYKAINNTRITGNDLTYFLGFIIRASVKFCLIYKNLEEINKFLAKTGDSLSSVDSSYVKKILIHNPDGFFTYKLFLKYIGGAVTKQGALKILNRLTDYSILQKSQNKKGENIYKLNPDLITYKYN